MAADEDDAQDAVRRILQDRPPEKLPKGAKSRLQKRLDAESQTARPATPHPARGPAARKIAVTKKGPPAR